MKNIFKEMPENLPNEIFEKLASGSNFKLERIISKGHIAPEKGWFNQETHEWVILLQGHSQIEFKTGEVIDLQKGDYLEIPAGCEHRVSFTSSEPECIWLALHYD